MAVGYCKNCINFDGRDWCKLRREEHEEWDKCTSTEGYCDEEEEE